ncbi:MAG: Ig-like domain-containing protein, partial [Bacteroidota bacterium]|nr:Ig-like domain-containing protein [Bacteroidota bacterium]
SPYTIKWNNVAAGSYSLTAKATDNSGLSTTSSAVAVTVKASLAPEISITSPVANASFDAPAYITISANATDADGSITKVEFYAGASLIGTVSTSPYTIIWSNVAAGSYSITAKATDNSGLSTTSNEIKILVSSNIAPVINLTSPTTDAVFGAPGNISISADASDEDGTISKVEFYSNDTLIGTASSSPYKITWRKVKTGDYTLTVKAIDNSGLTTTSLPVTVRVINDILTKNLNSKSEDFTFTSFTGNADFGKINLGWEVSTEGTKNFEIERSNSPSDLTTFVTLSTQKSKGTSFIYSINNYQLSKTNGYYRIKRIGIDKSITYSSIIYIQSFASSDKEISRLMPTEEKETLTYQLYPNPANDYIHILAKGSVEKPVIVSVLSMHGNELIRTTLKNTLTPLNISQLSSGVYIVQIKAGNEIIHKRFIKQ